jgi:hypothetical protein
MKAEIYNALAAINRSFDVTLESFKILKDEGVLAADYIQQQTEVAEELRSILNYMVLDVLRAREREDRDHWGAMRRSTEGRLK